jgi:lipid-binding SYLF domain-containing protein
MRAVTCGLAAAAALSLAGPARAASDEIKRVQESALVFQEIMRAPDQEIPASVLDRAEAIAIFPAVTKAGFIVGGQWGRGVITVREPTSRRWSAPAFLTLGGGSFGPQIGATSVDLVLIVMNRRGVEHLLSNEFKIGADASVALGPVGRTAEASTDGALRAEILSYSRGRGFFAGATLNGSMLKEDRDANTRYYGRALSSEDIVFARYDDLPDSAKELREAIVRDAPPPAAAP